MLSRFLTKVQSLCKYPVVCDFGIVMVVIPTFTYLAYCKYSESSSIRDWQYDRLMKRDAYIASKCLPIRDPNIIRRQYLHDLSILSQIKEVNKKFAECFFKLNAVNNELINDSELRDKVINDTFIESIITLLQLRDRIKAMNSKALLYEFCVFEESALQLLLTLSLNPVYKKYMSKIEEVMKSVRYDNTPYTLKNAHAESYFFNTQKSSTGIIYDGRVACMNPERMEKYDTDILFIHGQQSHCFTSWRILNPQDTILRLTSKRTYLISTLWPPKFLSDKYASRLLSLNYLVLCLNINRLHRAG